MEGVPTQSGLSLISSMRPSTELLDVKMGSCTYHLSVLSYSTASSPSASDGTRASAKALRSVDRRCNLLDQNAFKDYLAIAEYRENKEMTLQKLHGM